jgi:hypothetical protein
MACIGLAGAALIVLTVYLSSVVGHTERLVGQVSASRDGPLGHRAPREDIARLGGCATQYVNPRRVQLRRVTAARPRSRGSRW